MKELKCVLWGYRTRHNVIVELKEQNPKRICDFDPVKNYVFVHTVKPEIGPWHKHLKINYGKRVTIEGLPFAYLAVSLCEFGVTSNTYIYKVIDGEITPTPTIEDDLWI